tara:strand:- start:424 stop:579 length:156 start_codon:yes stop_codon:yes gene_type:complete
MAMTKVFSPGICFEKSQVPEISEKISTWQLIDRQASQTASKYGLKQGMRYG